MDIQKTYDNRKILEVSEKVLGKMQFKGEITEDTRTKSIQDRADEIIDDIEAKHGFHVCNLSREEVIELSKALSRLAEFL